MPGLWAEGLPQGGICPSPEGPKTCSHPNATGKASTQRTPGVGDAWGQGLPALHSAHSGTFPLIQPGLLPASPGCWIQLPSGHMGQPATLPSLGAPSGLLMASVGLPRYSKGSKGDLHSSYLQLGSLETGVGNHKYMLCAFCCQL